MGSDYRVISFEVNDLHLVSFGDLRAASLDLVRRAYWLTKPFADVRNWLNERERAILDRVLTDS
jgi:hypothetical protein